MVSSSLKDRRYWLEYSNKETCDVSRSLSELGNIREEVVFACILKAGAGDGAQRLRVEIKQAMLQVAPA